MKIVVIKISFLITLFINTCYATTGSMAGIELNSKNIKINCSEMDENSNYNCCINYKNNIKNLSIIKNNDCSLFKIYITENENIKINCSYWGIEEIYYYTFNKNDWHLYQYDYEKLPMDAEDVKTDSFSIKIDSNRFNIDRKITSLNIIKSQKQPLYKNSNENSKTKMYLIKDDVVEIREEKEDWIYILYISKDNKEIKAWIPKNTLEYRNSDEK